MGRAAQPRQLKRRLGPDAPPGRLRLAAALAARHPDEHGLATRDSDPDTRERAVRAVDEIRHALGRRPAFPASFVVKSHRRRLGPVDVEMPSTDHQSIGFEVVT
jgi:hypothetical protein